MKHIHSLLGLQMCLQGMDHRILFQLMKEYGFQDSYIAACRQLYSASNTYYMTIHGNTAPLPIYRDTL